MSLSRGLYTTLFKRNPVFVSACFFGGFFFMVGFDQTTTAWWDRHNYPKQWKDIRPKYISNDGADDDDDE